MRDPYSILGIQQNASDEEIKKAYRNLSRKYHPDANIDNPNKDQAEARFKEVQQAYRQIMQEREYQTSARNNPYGSSGSSGGHGSFAGSEDYDPFGGFGSFGGFGPFGSFQGTGGQYRHTGSKTSENEDDLHMKAAFNFINSGHYREALNLLNGITEHNALWYYCSALANSGIGNNVISLQHAREALRLEPDNFQYQVLVNRLESGGSWYQQQQGPYQTTFAGDGSWCMKLCLANLVCNLCCNGGMCFTGGNLS